MFFVCFCRAIAGCLHLLTKQKHTKTAWFHWNHEKVPFFQCQHPNVWMAWIRELSNNQNQPLSCWFPPEKSFPEIRVGIPCYVFPQILRRSSRKLPPNLPNGSKKQIDLWSSALLSCDRAAGWQPQEAGESLTLMSKKNHPERMKPDSKIIFIYNDFPPFFFPRERLADYSKKGDRKKRCWCMWLLIWAYEFLLPQEAYWNWLIPPGETRRISENGVFSFTHRRTSHSRECVSRKLCAIHAHSTNQCPTSLAKLTFPIQS